MPWIYFSRDEPPAPSLRLPSLDGELLAPADFRGISGLALLFAHGLYCPACLAWISELAEATAALRVHGAEALVILPAMPAQPLPGLNLRSLLVDKQGALRQNYAAIFEFNVTGNAMLFILNQFGAPFRAWVGDEPDPTVFSQMLKYLESAALLCPE